jgi:hypothetical protein
VNSYCTCSVETISSAGFTMREGIAYCNSCLKPEVTSSPIQQTLDKRKGNAISSLFDFKFEEFVSVAYSRFVYALIVILWTFVAAAGIILVLINASYLSGAVVILLLLGIPLAYLLVLIISRMSIEFTVLFFRIGRDIQALRENS